MLQIYYDILDKCLDRVDFGFCEMDTDSAYIAINSENLESLIKPKILEEYTNDKCNWFTRTDTIEHARYKIKKTPGLFKRDFWG